MSIDHAVLSDPQALRDSLARLPGVTTARELFSGPEPLPVAPTLAPVFARGGLPRGEIFGVSGQLALSFACAAAAQATQEQHWCAAVETHELAVAGLADLGIDLEHFVHVRTPPEDWQRVVSILIETFDVLIVDPPVAPRPQDRQRLAAKIREKRTSLIALGGMPGAAEHCTVDVADWSGLQAGSGRLAACTARIRHPRTGEHLISLPTASGTAGTDRTGTSGTADGTRLAASAAPQPAAGRASARGRMRVIDGVG